MPAPSTHPIILEVENTLKELFPKQTPEERHELLKLVLKDIDDLLIAERKPTLATNMKELKPHIDDFIFKHLFEKEFEKTLKLYIKDPTDKEKEDLKNEIKKDMEKMQQQKNGMDFKKNPKALEIMMKLLLLKHSLSRSFDSKHPGFARKLKVDPKLELQNNISKLKMEYMKLLKELETKLDKNDPLILELKNVMKNIFRDLDKKIELQQEPKDELTKLFRVLVSLSSFPPKEEEFKDLSSEQKVKIITQGSDSGKYASIPRNDVDMPNDVIVFPNTPVAAEKKDPILHSPFDISQGPEKRG